jgi:hypothetical protein
VGLTLAEMKRVVRLAHDGTNPCPEIVQKRPFRGVIDGVEWNCHQSTVVYAVVRNAQVPDC